MIKVTPSFQFAKLSKQGYRHFPILYFAYGTNGFILTLIGCSLTFKWDK